jgi:hypothetical protein
MLNLTGLSFFCLLLLLGLFRYTGSLLPATTGADRSEAVLIWGIWGVMVAVPLVTCTLWVLRLTKLTNG